MSGHSTPGNDKATARRPGFLGRFVRDRSGSTALEFAALALPFCMLVFAILESCISFAGQEVMANATDDVARQLRTGKLTTVAATPAEVKNRICNRLEVMVAKTCPGLSLDLRSYTSFEEAAKADFKIANGDIQLTKAGKNDTFTFSPGGSGQINMLRVFYKWPVMTDFMSKWMANLNSGKTLHFASTTWQNEAY